MYSVDHFVRAGETLSSARLEKFSGGKGLNQSLSLARAGAAVYHAGCIGADGEMLLGLLKESVGRTLHGDAYKYHQTGAESNGSIYVQSQTGDTIPNPFKMPHTFGIGPVSYTHL